jgi:UDP-N-acetylmuramate--alanine ligase
MNIESIRTVYFSGIGGIGMSALAQLMVEEGKNVLGSDIAKSQVTQKLELHGIHVEYEQDGTAIPEKTSLFVYSDAIPADHPERVAATKAGIPQLSYFEAVGEYMQLFDYSIAISGTHGKTTTTAMVANVLINAGFDPTVIVGSVMKELKSNARAGSKKMIVVEACEHNEHMLKLKPDMIVLTNIEADHLDYYRDLDHITSVFQKYVNHLPTDGVLIKNADDSECRELGYDGTVVSYGIDQKADMMATNIHASKKQQYFTAGKTEFALKIPGRFNVYNALSAVVVGRHLNIDEEVIKKSLHAFTGVWRRFEVIGEYKDATIISDYAHHPTAIHSTIKGAREFYPDRRIVVVFQPHQRSRTQNLFNDFVDSVSEADYAVIQEIYDVAGREEGVDVSSQQIVHALSEKGKYAVFTDEVAATRKALDEAIEKNDVVLVMGAGSIYKLAEELV